MRIGGLFRTARKADHAIPEERVRPLLGKEQLLDVRLWVRPPRETPLLLVTASRKQGMAHERNAFRRRVRMALLQLLRENPSGGGPGKAGPLGSAALIWVRPGRDSRRGCRLTYAEIEAQLRLALSHWGER